MMARGKPCLTLPHPNTHSIDEFRPLPKSAIQPVADESVSDGGEEKKESGGENG